MQTSLRQQQGGVLLIEVLIALALFLAISTIIAQALSVGFVSEKASRTRAGGTAMLEELLTLVRASSEEHWDNIGSLSRGVPYAISQVGGQLQVATGSATVTLDGVAYERSFTVRDATRAIGGTLTPLTLTATTSSRNDAGALVIDGTVTWGKGESLRLQTIITRWRNIVCGQTAWGVTGSSSAYCETATVPISGRSNIQVGDTLQLCTGC
ncbi:MAG TPA: hypothetical protein VJ579_01245 [Candidatus Paceibacterota bacterium]|nr:hypothetical protein [Candidatus Paceibacterota bacterium]